jgi:hypothetical protein
MKIETALKADAPSFINYSFEKLCFFFSSGWIVVMKI